MMKKSIKKLLSWVLFMFDNAMILISSGWFLFVSLYFYADMPEIIKQMENNRDKYTASSENQIILLSLAPLLIYILSTCSQVVYESVQNRKLEQSQNGEK